MAHNLEDIGKRGTHEKDQDHDKSFLKIQKKLLTTLLRNLPTHVSFGEEKTLAKKDLTLEYI